ncbi:PAS domain-containing sensor histidine kinase [Roseofilum reptotaenium CS-1145]|uniref:histidine kinase n=1 Tax=Roseofilum reptotaenium AO1-A TaxID=1925591 RepID=A0A1L9QVX4_9CYAN|nr:PAS domain-containing sensor histidine kinase [Roseofilum reptotaenium]MDB9518072.1 PAS domain-containing sensor histidine kinase [Roseofilum reptotaenium CS-1145]OJJ26845.1 PAS domain-containing sensor histidine kinase [Roseofilum reptotaenium AO1-A]
MTNYAWFPTSATPPSTPLDQPVAQDFTQLLRQHQLILNAVGEGVYGLDLEGNVTFVNPAAAAMIDWSTEELIGMSMHAVLHHSHADGTHYCREDCPIYAALQDGSTHRVTTEVFWRKDGTSFPVEYISTPMREDNGRLIGAVVTFRDISQRRWAEEVLQRSNEELELKVQERTAKLRQVNQQLQELSEMRSRFIAMLCHEFRNPLNNITLSVSSLKRYDLQLTAVEKADYLLGINNNVERMTQMIDDILVIGKIEAKVLEIKPQPLDFIQFCRQLLAERQYTRPESPIEFISRSRQAIAYCDERLLRSILNNLLSNALRYTPTHKAIRLKFAKRQNHVIFTIQDEGIGIPSEDKPHLFELFHRGRNVSNIPGTGLGLSIVKQFVELQQGTIQVKSQVNQGTTFTVRLPVKFKQN